MNSGLAESIVFLYQPSYSNYRTDLGTHSTSPDDATALLNTPSGTSNPVTGSSNILVKPATGRAVGLSTADLSFANTPCPTSTFTGSGCIGVNVSAANTGGILRAAVE